MVAGEDDDGAVRLSARFQRHQHRSDEFINTADARVIVREVNARGRRVGHPWHHLDFRGAHILRRGVGILRIHKLALHMLPPRRMGVAGIAPEEPGLVPRCLDACV